MKKLLTLCIPCVEGKVLLGLKKRGFGVGKWNGFGGKVSVGETIETAAFRELKEEVDIVPASFQKVGILEFSFAGDDELLEVHVFRINSFTGTPIETEEMNPAWFEIAAIPFSQMWLDDKFWFPYLLANKKFKGEFHFAKPSVEEHSEKILSQDLREVESL